MPMPFRHSIARPSVLCLRVILFNAYTNCPLKIDHLICMHDQFVIEINEPEIFGQSSCINRSVQFSSQNPLVI